MTSRVTAHGARGRRRSARPGRRVLLAALVAALVAAIAVGRFFGVPPRVLEDEQAAAFADGGLLRELSMVAARASDPAAATASALRSGLVGDRVNEDPYRWTLLTTADQTVTVAAYYSWGTDPLVTGLSGRAPWGRACRLYTVDPAPVRAQAVECPAGTPEDPPL